MKDKEPIILKQNTNMQKMFKDQKRIMRDKRVRKIMNDEKDRNLQRKLLVILVVLVVTMIYFFFSSITTKAINECIKKKGENYCERKLG